MKSKKLLALFSLFLLSFLSNAQTAVNQALEVLTNDMTNGGDFQIQLKVRGTNLPPANTLGSATIDITYDNSKLTYINSSNWAFGFAEGYSRSATDNTTFVRVLVTGDGVNENGGGDPPGFDITTNYVSWVQLNFIIANASGITDLTIEPGSNAIGLFQNYQNEPNTGTIINQVLSPPTNILDEPLSVTGIATFVELPKDFELSQNYPNPFNPDTRIEFGVPDKGKSIRVEIVVYDILGQKVRTLVDQGYEPGYYFVVWDGKNGNGQELVSGFYFFQLRSANFVRTRKLLLLR